jgi:hypothetical protein
VGGRALGETGGAAQDRAQDATRDGATASPGLARRTLLLMPAVVVPGLLVAGCSATDPGPDGSDGSAESPTGRPGRPPRPTDAPTLEAESADTERRLLAAYDAVLARHPELAARLATPRAHHEEHLDALGAATTEAATTTPEVPRRPAAALALLEQLEARAGRAAQRAAVAAEDATLAGLLASIGAAEAGHAEALRADPAPATWAPQSGPRVPTPAPLSGAGVAAVREAAAGTQAAEYATELALAFLQDADDTLARRALLHHRDGLDLWLSVLATAGVAAPAAATGYALPRPVRDAADARRLLAGVETRLAPLLVAAVEGTTGPLRRAATLRLADSVTLSLRWGARPTAFPGR